MAGVLGAWPNLAVAAQPEPMTIEPGWFTPRTGIDRPGPRHAGERILFVNFEGQRMQWCGEGVDTPHNNCSAVFQGYVMPYSGGWLERAVMIQAVRQDLEGFHVKVTDRRPEPDAGYDMEMIGDWNPEPYGGFAGIASSIDCFDNFGPETSFTLEYTDSALALAAVVLQEVAHTWGLQHVADGGDLLYPSTNGDDDQQFRDACLPLVGSGDPVALCPAQAEMFCDPGLQNSYQQILALWGPSTPDMEPPTVAIVVPADGGEVLNDFEIELALDDNNSPQLFHTVVEFDTLFSDTIDLGGPGVGRIPVSGVPDGTYDLAVTVVDEDGNTAMDTVSFTVTPDAAGDETTGTSGSSATGEDQTSDDGSDTTDEGGSDEATDGDDGPGGQVAEDGCSCSSAPPQPPVWLIWAVLVCRRRPRYSGRTDGGAHADL